MANYKLTDMFTQTEKDASLATVRDIVKWFTEKLTNEDILNEDGVIDPTYCAAAVAYIESYAGDFDFMVDLRSKMLRYGDLSIGQLRGGLNVLRAEVQREEKKAGNKPEADFVGVPIHDGTYTIVFPDGKYRTIRLRTAKWGDMPAGSQVVSFLSGPDNERSFTNFGFVFGRRLQVWKRFEENALGGIVEAAKILLECDDEGIADAGEAYALKSGHCCRCGRVLTVPASLHRGMGAECAKKG